MSVGELDVRPRPEPDSAPARSRAETRRRLLEAAVALFAEKGLHGVTSAQIARGAGVATGTFYLHFADKEALFHEIAFAALAELRARQERVSTGLEVGSRPYLRARTEELIAFTAEKRELILMVFGSAESAGLADEVREAVVSDIQRWLERRHAAGRTPSDLHPAVAAQAHAAVLTRVITWWAADPSRATAEQVVATLLRMNPSLLPPAAG
jgi:AcrR family transcriptional regulator